MTFKDYNKNNSKTYVAQLWCAILQWLSLSATGISLFFFGDYKTGDEAFIVFWLGLANAIFFYLLKSIFVGTAVSNYYKFMELFPEHKEMPEVD